MASSYSELQQNKWHKARFVVEAKLLLRLMSISLFTLLNSYFVVKVKLLVRPSSVDVPQPKLNLKMLFEYLARWS
ncbi:hypothetical protein Tco_0467176 [Tanacetum coccineum]